MSFGASSNDGEQKASGAQESQQQAGAWGNGASWQNALSNNASASNVWGAQAPFLQNLFGMAQAQANPGGATQGATQAAAQNTPALGMALRNTSALTDPTSQIQAQTRSLQSGLGQLFREEINPALTSNAIAAGGLGGGRQGVAQGVASGQMAQAFTQGLGDIVANARGTAVNAANTIPGLAQSNLQSRLAPASAGMDVLGQLAAILGAPTLLNQSFGTSRSQGSSQQKSGSASSGWSHGYQKSKGESGGSGFDFGWG